VVVVSVRHLKQAGALALHTLGSFPRSRDTPVVSDLTSLACLKRWERVRGEGI